MEEELTGQYTMPGIGFGTLGNTGDAGCALVEAALAEGYRYIDTSRFYGNEEAVGKAMARSSVPRGDIWVTTKLWDYLASRTAILVAADPECDAAAIIHPHPTLSESVGESMLALAGKPLHTM